MLEHPFDHLLDTARCIWILVMVEILERGQKDIVSARKVRLRAAFEDPIGPLLQLRHFRVGQKRPPLERLGPLERRCALADPDSLKVRLAVRSLMRISGLGRGGDRRQQDRQRDGADTQ
jgi:hypothetical protein